ncbi:MAG TPA: hypothetical protein PKI05_14335 [Thermogutta sp.]|nr:hypothetical protein [Thermogutta sp.]HOP78376.1 hypothetical protein [Thermogutta sp.]HPU05434.1 hypothetical protein [Thermogutta sp.]HPZ81858.1 hypothetical protein [Thermogutta sp.]HQF14572.1 hypothetical protein [Thermogutta sp.]
MVKTCSRRISQERHSRLERRFAVTTMEIIVAMFLLATLAMIASQIIATVVQTRVEQRKRAFALQEAGNAMEEAFLLSWQELKPGQSRQWTCSDTAAKILKNAKVTLVTEATPDDNTRRLVVCVEWSSGGGREPQRIQLVAFRHRAARSEEAAAAREAKGTEKGIAASEEK